MYTVISYLPLTAVILLGIVAGRLNKRPSARARWAARSLREKINRIIRIRRNGMILQAGYLVMFTALHLAGVISRAGWLAGMFTVGFGVVMNLHYLRQALDARRAYRSLGPLAYLAEVRHAFGPIGEETPNGT